MSTGVLAMKMPLRPPITNIDTNARALSIGTGKEMRPPHRVPSQLNVLMAEGTAMIIVVTMKAMPSVRSKSSMATAEVSTGSASSSRIAVMNNDQMTSGMRNSVMPGARMLMIVVM